MPQRVASTMVAGLIAAAALLSAGGAQALAPKPTPLPERQTLTVAVQEKAGFMAPLLLVPDALDSLNITVKTVNFQRYPDSRTAILSEAVDIAIVTDMGSARNNIIVLTSDVVISCGVGGAGTASEVALALKAKKHVVLLGESQEARSYFKTIGHELVHTAVTAAEAVQIVSALFAS